MTHTNPQRDVARAALLGAVVDRLLAERARGVRLATPGALWSDQCAAEFERGHRMRLSATEYHDLRVAFDELDRHAREPARTHEGIRVVSALSGRFRPELSAPAPERSRRQARRPAAPAAARTWKPPPLSDDEIQRIREVPDGITT